MGPLVQLLKAYALRGEFLCINRDIVNTFNLLAAGQQLTVCPGREEGEQQATEAATASGGCCTSEQSGMR